MALTSAQQAEVIFYLGWPAKSLVVDSTHYNTTLVTRLTGLSADSETLVTGLLTKIGDVRTKLDNSTARMLVKKVGDIELNTDENMYLNKDFRRLVRELSDLLDIPVMGGDNINIGVVC